MKNIFVQKVFGVKRHIMYLNNFGVGRVMKMISKSSKLLLMKCYIFFYS